MIEISGYFYNGQSSEQIPVTVCFYQSGEVLIEGEALTLNTTIEQLSIVPRLANTRRNIFLNDGSKLETDDNKAIDDLCRYFDKNIFHLLLHKLEKNWSYALIALIATIIFLWGSIEYAVPTTVKWAAKGIPYSIEQDIGERGLETLDKWLFSPSVIDKVEQIRLQKQFKILTASSKGKYHYQLLLRTSEYMGANALALPGGIIILTDSLFKLAENDQQIISVLAHEMGHIEHQHALRLLFQSSITALFMAGVLGDMSSVTSLSVTLPTVLVERRYSREFEQEADQYAVSFLKVQKMDVDSFTRILTLLEQAHDVDTEFDYLSSHPAMHKRIELINSGAGNGLEVRL